MKIIGAPGIKPETVEWMSRLTDALQFSAAVEILKYRHWQSGDEADVKHEARQLAQRRPDLVIAKSLGSMIAATAFESEGFQPGQAVFIGSPLNRFGESDYRRLSAMLRGVPTLLIQQDRDPTGSFRELRNHVGNPPNCRLVEVVGNDHIYTNIDELAEIVRAVYGNI
jgi:hypothetical protein